MNDRTAVFDKFWALAKDLCQNLLEREQAIEAALLALLAKEHLLLLGPPGTAKSLLARSICERITGAVYFERLLTRFSTPEELFGPLSLSALEQDRYQRITKGTIVEAHIAFLDEIFKANSAILNSLLSLLNERIYHEAGEGLPVPLVALIAASNETPEDDGLAALYDRFLLRVTVPCIADDDNLKRLLELEEQPMATSLALDDITAAQKEVLAIPLSDEAKDAIIAVKHDLETEGVAASDRRWRAAAKILKAKAWLEGDTSALAVHAETLVHVLWTDPAHIRLVERVVGKVANPLNLEAVELEDAAKDLYLQRPTPDAPNLTEALEPLLRQLSDIHTRLEQRIAKAPEKRSLRARQALKQVETYHRALSQLALQGISRLHMAPGAG